MFHEPVMLEEVLQVLALKPGAVVVDGTLGLAGHARVFLKAISPGGTLVGFDWDQTMLAEASETLREKHGNETELFHGNFREAPEILEKLGLRPDGILLDLGLNSAQLEDPERGIAFRHEGPLDMRMDRTVGEPASALLNRLSPGEIETILWNYGDERWAKAIAKKIVERRRDKPLRTTADLIEVVLDTVPPKARSKNIHPATQTFQAVRIAVNKELEGLEESLVELASTLADGGTIVVLSYHSGEDRAVKKAFRQLSSSEEFDEIFRKPLQPSAAEVARNPRSRSAKLRAIRRR